MQVLYGYLEKYSGSTSMVFSYLALKGGKLSTHDTAR